ncbi:anhydro-N-acetylmuramic acid kinase [Roseofilum sp. Guam]|uniref:anhydro-N-acetylmuramic acid kinase n=1 Tax=Roseofilum sp. Guam TaxID=2821502 RepID=UPI001B1B4D1F|nr:anhydro-N-acetylmuramic acid kinase [Roseofilum sp. Guam]MBP0031108.1 anhydro-N-acetylmuramic acid kinase [Roseofilum sp. Guam]
MYIIGLISGTSADGIDAALVEISGEGYELKVDLIAGETYAYPEELQREILAIAAGTSLSLPQLAAVDDKIAQAFSQAALKVQQGHPPAQRIASHGQTVFHRPPNGQLGYSLQLGRGEAIAYNTRIPTISNFRQADIAAGGQGAPLVPPIDACLLSHPTQSQCIQNLGGIGNLTYLPVNSHQHLDRVRGWDTGPGNSLLDLAVEQLTHGTQHCDLNGAWAASGTPCQPLVDQWMQDPYFQQLPPKSTGREYFGWEFWQRCWQEIQAYALSDADILATLTEFTAVSVKQNYHQFLPQMPDRVLLCGGGSRNLYLKERIQHHLSPIQVLTTEEMGLNAEFKEAIAFAVLGYWYHLGIPGNLPQVTGANSSQILGHLHPVGTHRTTML